MRALSDTPIRAISRIRNEDKTSIIIVYIAEAKWISTDLIR